METRARIFLVRVAAFFIVELSIAIEGSSQDSNPSSSQKSEFFGRIVDGNGNPVAAQTYLVIAENLSQARYRKKFPKTGSNGEFSEEHEISDDRASVFLIHPERHVEFWSNLPTKSSDLKLVLGSGQTFDAPPDWETFGDLWLMQKEVKLNTKSLSFDLPDLNGKRFSLDSTRLKGKAVLVNIWGTWCGGCKFEIPILRQLGDEFGKSGLDIVGIAFEKDTTDESISKLRNFVAAFNINYPVLVGGDTETSNVENKLQGLTNFDGFPHTLILDKHGRVVYEMMGIMAETKEREAWFTERLRNGIRAAISAK